MRKFVMVIVMLAGLSLCLTPPAPAYPPCPYGHTCSQGHVLPCDSYCKSLGLTFDYCNMTTHCCICS